MNTLFIMISLLFFHPMPCNFCLIYILFCYIKLSTFILKTIFKGIWNEGFRLLVAHSIVSTYWDITFRII